MHFSGYMFYPQFVVKKKFWVWGIWGWFYCTRNSTPTNKLTFFMLAMRFFQFSNFGSNRGILTSSHKHIPLQIIFVCRFTWQIYHSWLANFVLFLPKFCIIFRHAKIFKKTIFLMKMKHFFKYLGTFYLSKLNSYLVET